MKNNLLLLFAFVMTTSTVVAQTKNKVDLIASAGVNISTVTGLDAREDRSFIKKNYTGGLFPRIGFNAGLQIQFNLTEQLGLKTGIIYSGKGWYTTVASENFISNTRFKLAYLDIPIMVQFELTNGLCFHAGPLVSVRTNETVYRKYFDLDDGGNEKDVDGFQEVFDRSSSPVTVGFQGGLGFSFGQGLGLDLTIQKNSALFLQEYDYSNLTCMLSIRKSLFAHKE